MIYLTFSNRRLDGSEIYFHVLILYTTLPVMNREMGSTPPAIIGLYSKTKEFFQLFVSATSFWNQKADDQVFNLLDHHNTKTEVVIFP